MSLLDDYPRLQAVARYAKEHIRLSAAQSGDPLTHIGPGYRWEHTLRVTQYGIQIAAAEAARIELVAAACLLHDSEWYFDHQADSSDHGRYAAREIRTFLEQVGYSTEEVDNISYSVAVHVDGNAGYEHEHTLEARVVSDADNVDRFGAVRTVLWCIDELDDLPALASKLEKRVQKLEEYRSRQVMETATGSTLFNHQLDRQIEFFNQLVAEHKLTHLP